MANDKISQVTLPNGTTYDIEDIIARQAIPFGQVDSTSTSTAFTATVPGITELKDGVIMLLKNGVVTSASGFTININELGAKPVYSNMAAATRETTLFNVNYTLLFIYDEDRVSGGCWINYRGYYSDANSVGYQLRTNSTVKTVTDTARYYKIYFTSADGKQWVPASVNSTNNATTARAVNQRPIDPFGRIVYTSASTSYVAGADLAATTIWSQYVVTLGYSFNRTGVALELTSKTPVYIKCAPQTNGSAIIDADTPYVQTLPTTADGKIYIYLGVAINTTQVELYQDHPVYWHDGTGIRLWNGSASDTTKVDKEALDDAGITGITYTTLLDTTTVTTATGEVHPKPYAFLTSSPSTISEGLTYRITVDGVEYTLQARGWFVRWGSLASVTSYFFAIAGNITYFETDPMFYDEVDDVPFLITTLIQPSSTSEESNGLYIFTQTEKSVSVKIELATFQGETLPNYLIRGETAKAIDKPYSTHEIYRKYNIGYNKGGSNCSFAIGIGNNANNFSYILGAGNITSDNNTAVVGTNNEVSATWSSAFGVGNIVSNKFSTAVGNNNQITGQACAAIGYGNQSTGTGSVAIGRDTIASGNGSFACGRDTQALGNYSIALGRYGIANGYYSFVNGYNTLSTHKSQFVFGEFNDSDTGTGATSERGNYIEIVGNGTADDARSNARTLDWNGNESLAGGLTLGMGTANETSITAQQLNALIPLASSGLITDANGAARKIYLTTTEAVPSGAVTGDIVFVKVT